MTGTNARSNGGKAVFTDAYTQPDPRAYYRELGALDYEVPQHGQRVFDVVLAALDVVQPTVVDLCCSYGVIAALMKHDIDLADLYGHYGRPELDDISRTALAAIDRSFFTQRRLDDVPRIVGLDISAPAVDYAVEVGILDDGHAANLELTDPDVALTAVMRDAHLITVTGGIGYIGERTFDRLLGCSGRETPPWVASLCLRAMDYQPVTACLREHGLVTEKLDGVTFPQRRFADATEREFALAQLEALGIDPDGRESDGAYHVDFFLSRPAEDVNARPLEVLFAGVTVGV